MRYRRGRRKKEGGEEKGHIKGRGSEREDGVSRIRERTKAGREKVRVGML